MLSFAIPGTVIGVSYILAFNVPPIEITGTAKIAAQTGVEMEALTAVSIAGLTIYDMCKAVDKSMRLTNVRLVSKTKR